jgi:acyl-[acyl carrier protein]--UDP-N-acetylglucosamine O-acyltransferase
MSSHDIIIHPTATVHPKARLASGVWVGPGFPRRVS